MVGLLRGPRSAFRWTAYVLAVTSFAAAIPTPLYPVYEERFHFSSGTLGLIFAAYTPGVLLTLFFLAPQAERIGRRMLLFLGMGLAILGAVAFAFAPGVLGLALARGVAGLSVGATTSVATAAMSDLEPNRDQHHVARVAVSANFGGFAVGVGLSGLILRFGPDSISLVYVLPVLAAVLGLVAVRAIPETAADLGRPLPGRVQGIAIPAAVRGPFVVSAGGVVACYAIYGLFAALVPSFLRLGFQLPDPLAAAAVVALMFGMAAVTQLFTPQIQDRRALLVGFPVLLGGLVLLVLVLPMGAWFPLLFVTLVLGIGVGLTFMGSVTLIDRVAPESQRGELLAAFYAAGYLALAVPTIGVAETSERFGVTSASILFGSFLAVAVAALFLQTLRTPTPPGGGGRVRTAPRPR